MKIRLVVALVGLAISFALATFAQQATTPDPQLHKAWVALAKTFDEAWNNNDPVALAGFYTEDAVMVTDHGPVYGREAIEKYYADLFRAGHVSNRIAAIDQYSPHIIVTAGNEVWSNGQWSLTLQGRDRPIQMKGYWSMVSVYEGFAWKCRMETWNITPAITATLSPTASPSSQ